MSEDNDTRTLVEKQRDFYRAEMLAAFAELRSMQKKVRVLAVLIFVNAIFLFLQAFGVLS